MTSPDRTQALIAEWEQRKKSPGTGIAIAVNLLYAGDALAVELRAAAGREQQLREERLRLKAMLEGMVEAMEANTTFLAAVPEKEETR